MAIPRGLLRCSVTYGSSAAIVRARGEVDVSSAEVLRQCLRRALARRRAVVVDLRGITYLDASGFRVLEEFAAKAASASRPFFIVPSRTVERLLRVLRIDTIPVAASIEEAIDRLTPPDQGKGPTGGRAPG